MKPFQSPCMYTDAGTVAVSAAARIHFFFNGFYKVFDYVLFVTMNKQPTIVRYIFFVMPLVRSHIMINSAQRVVLLLLPSAAAAATFVSLARKRHRCVGRRAVAWHRRAFECSSNGCLVATATREHILMAMARYLVGSFRTSCCNILGPAHVPKFLRCSDSPFNRSSVQIGSRTFFTIFLVFQKLPKTTPLFHSN